MTTEYETFINNIADLKEGESELVVRDKKTYQARRVRAIVSASNQSLPGGDTLYVRFSQGVLYKKPFTIKITRELDGLLIG